MRAKHWLGVLVVAFVSLQSAFAAAQVNRATISGTVPDPSTAAIPGVTITISVGQLSETVSVEGTPQLIQRETPEVGTTVTRDYLTLLPLS